MKHGSFGTSGLCTDSSDNFVFKETGKTFPDFRICRGEGAVLYNKNKERFVNELLPRDVVTKAI